MYFVVVLTTENSVGVVGEKWFDEHEKSRVMWPDNPRVLGNYFTLEEARRSAKLAEETSNLSSSEPMQKGKGCRRKIRRRLTSDSEDEVSDKENEPPLAERALGWPSTSQLSVVKSPATAAPSTSQSAELLPATMLAWMKAMEDCLEALEALIRQSNELNRRASDKITTKLDMLVKRVDHIPSEHSVLLAKVEKVGAAVFDSHRSIPTGSMAAVGRLPLCSQESLCHFLDRFKSDKDCSKRNPPILLNARQVLRSITINLYWKDHIHNMMTIH
ncbi:unnamed protein product [Dibothriocephalus latus]|uniref:Uncharacterized protein n=1 Tax=Dibothriocephalus latus TaxID=60516 RepID=A0A3P7LC61_DIBLA|nr:unnamed protein product [Dibothriocephalus latus]